MAKVSEIKFSVKGIDYKVNVNCNSSGQFNANIPKEVAEALRIDATLTSNTLVELNKIFDEKLKHYKTIETIESLHIWIAYQARGKYTYKTDGSILFSNLNNLYNIDVSFSEIDNAVGFDFFVAIKQVIDGKEKWFKAKLGSEFSWMCKKEYSQPSIYHKQESIGRRMERYKIIPFNETALNTLIIAQEKLRMVSEVLFNFINKDEKEILLTLTNQKLLG